MNIRVIVESLKFYKLKSANTVKVLFLLLILLRAFVTMAPVGDRDFSFIQNYLALDSIENITLVLPSQGNIVTIGIYIIGLFLSVLIAVFYAEIFILESEQDRDKTIQLNANTIFMIPFRGSDIPLNSSREKIADFVKSSFKPSNFKRNLEADNKGKFPYVKTALLDLIKSLPQLVIFLLILSLVFLFSLPLFMLPIIIVLLMTAFAPLNMLYAKNSLIRSIELSSRQTKGAKITIFFTIIMVSFLFNLLSSIFITLLVDYHYSYLVIEASIYAFEVLTMARLYAIFYQILALRQPYKT